jgi:hypothetical protein
MRWIVASSVFLLFACETTPSPAESWHTVFTGLPGALLSVTGTSDSDVWAVGSDANDGQGPLVLHFDGSAWKRYVTGISGDLWWAQVFADGSVFAGGTAGGPEREIHDLQGLGSVGEGRVVRRKWHAGRALRRDDVCGRHDAARVE